MDIHDTRQVAERLEEIANLNISRSQVSSASGWSSHSVSISVTIETPQKEITIDPRALKQLTDDEKSDLIELFVIAQDRLVSKCIADLKDQYGVEIKT